MGERQLPWVASRFGDPSTTELVAMVCLWTIIAILGATIGDTMGRVIVWESFPRNDWDGDLYIAMHSWGWFIGQALTSMVYLPDLALITFCLWYFRALGVSWWERAAAYFAAAVGDAVCIVIWFNGYGHEGWLASAEVSLLIAAIFVLSARLLSFLKVRPKSGTDC